MCEEWEDLEDELIDTATEDDDDESSLEGQDNVEELNFNTD